VAPPGDRPRDLLCAFPAAVHRAARRARAGEGRPVLCWGVFRVAARVRAASRERGRHRDWPRLLSVLLFSFAAVIASGLLLFDVVLVRREIPRILRDLLQGIAYLITAAIVLTRSEVDVTKVFTASVLTTAVIGLALQETLGNIMAGLALQLERDFEVGDWI